MPMKPKNGQQMDPSSAPLPPPLPPKQQDQRKPQKSNGGNVRGQVAMHLMVALLQSPELAGRFTTHDEFKQTVKNDTNEFLTFMDEEGLF